MKDGRGFGRTKDGGGRLGGAVRPPHRRPLPLRPDPYTMAYHQALAPIIKEAVGLKRVQCIFSTENMKCRLVYVCTDYCVQYLGELLSLLLFRKRTMSTTEADAIRSPLPTAKGAKKYPI